MGDKALKKNLFSYIIHPNIEPGVIDAEMLVKCIHESGPTAEAGRLFDEEGIHFDEARALRIEFLNIIRIDSLWMLKNLNKLSLAHNRIEKIENLERLTGLIELDLSFNMIVKIENLETLVKLEVLTLFGNKIKKLENMEALQELLVFSIGENMIEDYKEMAYLRKLRKLRTVSFKGNPCSDDPMSYKFIKSALSRVTYIDYILVKEAEREAGRSLFRGLLRKMDDADEKAEEARLAAEAYDAQVVFYAVSFVEYLSGTEMVETMFSKDPDGSLLLTYGGEITGFYETYLEQYVAIMANLVDYAQRAYKERQDEIKLFKGLVDSALEDSVKRSQVVIEEYQAKKLPLIKRCYHLQELIKTKKLTLDEVEPQLVEMTDTFNDYIYQMWRSLMTIEMRLFEQCEESRIQFGVNMSEKMAHLLENSRTAFGDWRQIDSMFTTRVFDFLIDKITLRKTPKPGVPSELHMMLTDRDVLANMVASCSDNHMRFIDAREDVLIKRASEWREEIVEGTNQKEIKRNRDRIMEINYFLDNEREDWIELHTKVLEVPEQELLMDI